LKTFRLAALPSHYIALLCPRTTLLSFERNFPRSKDKECESEVQNAFGMWEFL
jgi:hypothetical protein